MEIENKVKIKFIRQRGQCYPGYEAEFEAAIAKKLIKDGFAEAVKSVPKIKSKKVKSEGIFKKDK